MNKIEVKISNGYMTFSKYEKDIKLSNLNNTNVIDTKNLKFSEDYIRENLDLISTFFNLLIMKFNVTKVKIKDLDISEISLLLIKYLKNINEIYFLENKPLTYTICSLLHENININKIECYTLPEIMFYKFKHVEIITRIDAKSKSSFYEINNIVKQSDIYNKKIIIIPNVLKEEDITDIFYLLETNKNIKTIVFNQYSKNNIDIFLKQLRLNYNKKVNVLINEKSNALDNVLKDVNYLNRIEKKYNVNVKIKYSSKYKEKNKIKELNNSLLKIILLVSIILIIGIIILSKYLTYKDTKVVDKEINEIKEVIEIETEEKPTEEVKEEKKEEYVPSYLKDRTYSKLLEINSDTVGWLKINGTRVDYPVVQTTDNNYYLNHTFYKRNNIMGWLFVDYRNDMDNISDNTIIYGHSMGIDNSMFTTLQNILKPNWYNNPNNLTIDFSIKGVDYKWQVFSVYSIENTNDYLYTGFNIEENYTTFINTIKSRSAKDFGVEVSSTDKILTLSTCYKDNDHRVVLHAKKI